MGGGLWMRLQHRTIPCAIDLSACGLDQIEESDDAFVIGAMTPLFVLESHADFARAPKKDSAALLSGKPVFTADLAPAEALVVKLLRSPLTPSRRFAPSTPPAPWASLSRRCR